jgi:hypothetical protein
MRDAGTVSGAIAIPWQPKEKCSSIWWMRLFPECHPRTGEEGFSHGSGVLENAARVKLHGESLCSESIADRASSLVGTPCPPRTFPAADYHRTLGSS